MRLPDEVVLIKPDGTRYENIRADVQKEIVFIDDGSLPLEEGDTIVRELPNGLVEKYTVLDKGYFSGMSGGGEYQAEVRKHAQIQEQTGAKAVYNLHGPNARVNINSQDSSVNIINVESEKLFADLRQTIQEEIGGNEQEKLLELLSQAERSEGEPDFSESYAKFMALAANHASVLSPFFPALSQLLS